MFENIPPMFIYAILGSFLGIMPTILLFSRISSKVVLRHPHIDLRRIIAAILVISAGVWCIGLIASPILLGSFALIVVIAFYCQDPIEPIYSLAVFSGLVIAATLPWWRRSIVGGVNLSWVELIIFIIITTTAILMLQIRGSRLGSSARDRLITTLQIATFVVFASILSFTTGIFNNKEMLLTTWHHWGAYIGPSELLLAGAKLFYDFPAQYGFGPTVLIASVCGQSCWSGMYFIVGLATLLFSLLIAGIALCSSKQGLYEHGLILLLVIVCCFFWNSYPPNVSSPTITPSVNGLRFLPVLILVAFLLHFDRGEKNQPYVMKLGHMVWAAATIWSIESAFYATFVWWPYYLLRRAERAKNNKERTIYVLRAIGTLATLLVILVLCFLAGYWYIYKATPSVYGYFAYALNPPGPMPINTKGAVWFFLSVMVLGTLASWYTFRKYGINPAFRRGFLLLLLAYGTFSYFLGRSHDNNILNLSPFLLLVLLHIRVALIPNSWLVGISTALLACLLGWASVFGWMDWRATILSGKTLEFDPAVFRKSFSFGNPETAAKLDSRGLGHKINLGNPRDVARAISYIQQNYGEPSAVIDHSMLIASTELGSAWSLAHGPANFAGILPFAIRRDFLQKTADTLKQSGWLVIDKEFPANDLLADFDSVYLRTQVLDFGSYYAIRFEHLDKFDFLNSFSKGHINNPSKVDSPNGRGAMIIPWDTDLGLRNTLTIISGFAYRYDAVPIERGAKLFFGVSMIYPSLEPARAIVQINDERGSPRILYAHDLMTPLVGEKLRFKPIIIPLAEYAGKKVSITFSVDTPGRDSTGHWVGFTEPRIVQYSLD
jgi:hypothetical protein